MRPEAATLRLAVFPRSSLLTNILLVLGGAGFVALAAQVSISLPFTPVPITGQTFGVLVAGCALGFRRGAAAVALYVLIGAIGLPVFAENNAGLSWVLGRSGP